MIWTNSSAVPPVLDNIKDQANPQVEALNLDDMQISRTLLRIS